MKKTGEDSFPSERDLFSNLLGNHEEAQAEAKRKKQEEKKKLVQETTIARSKV